jgi:hypothetical protein
MQRGAAPTRGGGNDRRFFLFDSTLDLFLALTIIPFCQIDPVESVSGAGQSTPS